MLMCPDRDVTRNTQLAGFMIILFLRPFLTPSRSPYPWIVNWNSITLNLLPALIRVIHYSLVQFIFLTFAVASLLSWRGDGRLSRGFSVLRFNRRELCANLTSRIKIM